MFTKYFITFISSIYNYTIILNNFINGTHQIYKLCKNVKMSKKWCFRQKWQFSKKRDFSKKVGFSAKRVFFQKTGFSPKSGFCHETRFFRFCGAGRKSVLGTHFGAWDSNTCVSDSRAAQF